LFSRLGLWCHDRRVLVVIAWIVGLFVVNGVAGGVGNAFREEFNLPDVESRRGFDVIDEHFSGQGGGMGATIVFRAEQGVDDPEVQAAMEDLFTAVAGLDQVTTVVSPYSPEGAFQVSARGDLAGQVAFARLDLPEDTDFSQGVEIREFILDHEPDVDGLEIELGGGLLAEFEEPTSEIIGLSFAIVILILAFGSVLAMGLPIGVALFGIGAGTAIITLLSNVLSVPEFASFLGVMIGLGVGIDYALLIVTRYREQLHGGHSVREAVGVALDTAGRSVLFAGMTVVISLLGMLLMGVGFVQGLSLSAASVVALTVLASLTLLPALLGFVGERIEVTRWRGLLAAGLIAVALLAVGVGLGLPVVPAVAALSAVAVLVIGLFAPALKRVVQRSDPKPRDQTLAYRWSRVIQHHPWLSALGAGGLLVLLAVPVSSLHLGFSDEGNFAESTTTRRAYDLLTEGFGAGFNGPLIVAAELPADHDPAALEAITVAISDDEGIDFVTPAIVSDDGEAVLWQVIPTTGPQDRATGDTVNRLRDEVLPGPEAQLGSEVAVTGAVAVSLDFSSYLSSRYPYFFGAVLLLSFLLLMAVFRSVLVPLKAVLMNLLSIGASYGVVVALFQWGWLSTITGVQPAPIEPWAPMMLFAIVFGLSMDYEVFLLSRVREEWHRTGDSRTSVADGLAATAKVITAAAAIMVVVFGAFVLEPDRIVKLMGTGLAVAILLDATIVRMILVPATMELLGDRNWWLPRWLDRVLPDIDVEGHTDR